MKTYLTDEIELSYDDYVRLHKEGKCNLGLPNADADLMSRTPGYIPKGSGVNAAFMFFNLIGFGIFGYSIYLSFTSNWWYFIIGFFLSGFIWNVNKTSNVQNILSEALLNESFYNKLKLNPSTMYQIEEEDAKIFLKNKDD